MLDLSNAQLLLTNFILRGQSSPELLRSIIPGGNLSKDSALKVYREDYLARLSSVIGENYPAVRYILGNEIFCSVSDEFIKKYDSKSFDIGDFGEEFPFFLKNHPVSHQLPFLSELAILEKNFLRVFHSKLEIPGPLELAGKNPLDLKFRFIGGIHLQKSNYPIFKIWELKNKSSGDEIKVKMNESSNFVLFKNKFGIKTSFFSESQMDILFKLINGKKLGESLTENIEEKEVSEIFNFISSSGILLEVI